MTKRSADLPMADFGDAAVLRDILRGTATETGARFFTAFVESLSQAVNAHMAWVTEYQEGDPNLHALALTIGGKVQTNSRYPLAGTPCEAVIRGANLVHHVDNVQRHYPHDTYLAQFGLRSYLGVPLLGVDGSVLGHLAVMDKRPMPKDQAGLAVFQIFAARAAAELQRLRVEREQQQLKQLLQQANDALKVSEQRYRDLFDEAPIAYVHEDLDTRFIHANHTAQRVLGIEEHEVASTFGRDLVPRTAEAQKRLEQALGALRRGERTEPHILELRRKSDGEPVWIRWWSSPAPDGTYTRTMFIDITEQVLTDRRNAVLEAQNTYLQEELRGERPTSFIGSSKRMRQVFEDIAQVARTSTTVLVLGETGTGKELAARAIHEGSPRAGKPLIKVNCAALPSSLIESELFGHVKGAFTGAAKARDGRFMTANGGTIFLDEIGEIPIDLQVKLLRVLQEGEIERLGSSTTVSIDVRVIAATNRNLLDAIQKGQFREDLYYRLAVFPIEMPPLREREDDVVALANEFSARYAARIGKAIRPLTETDARRLKAYSWPGNVRELQNVIERAVLTAANGELNLDRALPETVTPPDMPVAATPTAVMTARELETLEKRNIVLALEACRWRISGADGAAKLLGVNPSTLSSRIKAFGIKRPT